MQNFKPADLIIPEDFDNHWQPNLTHEQYHADKTAIGSSSLALLLSSPKAFYEGHFLGKQKPPTRDMELGTIIHKALLEGPEFEAQYVVMPVFEGRDLKGNLTTNANCKEVKEKRQAWLEANAGRIIVTESDLEMIRGMVASVKAHPQGEHVFAHGSTERSGYYRDPKTGIKCKIRPDFHGHDFFLVTDFKSVRSSEQKLFGAQAFREGRLDLRLWMYAYGIGQIENMAPPENLFFMVCEKTWPYESAVYFMTEEQRNQAQFDYNRAMKILADCIESDQWPQRQKKMEPLWTPKFFIDADVEMHEKELEDAGF